MYWCLTNVLAGIQDHYTADQPGVQRMVMRLEELVRRIDSNLCEHFAGTGIEFIQFAFKWMNCLLLREFNMRCVVRLWDTYLSEDHGGFENFHVYVCAAFLCQFSQTLQEMTFDKIFGFMQVRPRWSWSPRRLLGSGKCFRDLTSPLTNFLSTFFVIAGSADRRLGRDRNRDASEPSIRIKHAVWRKRGTFDKQHVINELPPESLTY